MLRVVSLIAAAALVAACGDDGTGLRATTPFGATLNAASEVPPATAPAAALTATGTFNATLDGNVVVFDLTSSGFSGTPFAAHIHGPATVTQAVNPIFDFNAPPAGHASSLTRGATTTATGRIDLTLPITKDAAGAVLISGDSLRKLLEAGLLYVNVHTVANPGGEIRGQILKK